MQKWKIKSKCESLSKFNLLYGSPSTAIICSSLKILTIEKVKVEYEKWKREKSESETLSKFIFSCSSPHRTNLKHTNNIKIWLDHQCLRSYGLCYGKIQHEQKTTRMKNLKMIFFSSNYLLSMFLVLSR